MIKGGLLGLDDRKDVQTSVHLCSSVRSFIQSVRCSVSPPAPDYTYYRDQPLSNEEHLALSGKLPLLKGLREQGFIPRALPMVKL